MFDVGFWELTVIGVVALFIVGPERLPGLVRTTAMWVGKARRMLTDVKKDIDRELKADEMADLSDVKTEFDKVKKQVKSTTDQFAKDTGINEIKQSVNDTVKQVEQSAEMDELDQVAKSFSDDLDQSHTQVKEQVGVTANQTETIAETVATTESNEPADAKPQVAKPS